MAVEMFSWPSLHERMCRTWGLNSGPLACQVNTLPIELLRPVKFRLCGTWQQNGAASWQNQQNGMCAQQRLRLAWASAQSDQSLHCPQEESLGPVANGKCAQRRLRSAWHPPSLIRVFAVHKKKAWVLGYPLSAQRRLWSDWADAQANLSLGWAHMPFYWFCHEAARINFKRTGEYRYPTVRASVMDTQKALFQHNNYGI